MADVATAYEQQVHQNGQTVAWSILLNVAIMAGALRYDRVAAALHAVLGVMVLILTYTFVLYFLIPYGFNVNNPLNWELYGHGIIGCMLLGFVLMQVAGGAISRLAQEEKKTEMKRLQFMRRMHRYFGYFLALFYKTLVIWAWWFNSIATMVSLIIWEVVWIAAFIMVKLCTPRIEQKITDHQTEDYVCPEIAELS